MKATVTLLVGGLVLGAVSRGDLTDPAGAQLDSGASAQAMAGHPVTWEATYWCEPDQRNRYVELTKRDRAPVMAELIERGVVLAWGLQEPTFHADGGHGRFRFWVTLPNYAAIDAFLKALDEVDAERDEASGGAPMFKDIVDYDRHTSLLFHEVMGQGRGTD